MTRDQAKHNLQLEFNQLANEIDSYISGQRLDPQLVEIQGLLTRVEEAVKIVTKDYTVDKIFSL